MQIIPAVDLLDGSCVRLFRGDYSRARNYSEDPEKTVEQFYRDGARTLHTVDLNAARGDRNINRALLKKICRAFPGFVQSGGGIRHLQDAEELLHCGVRRLILGTALMETPEAVRSWREALGNVFWAGLDASGGRVRVKGWKEEGLPLEQAIRLSEELDLGGIVYTDIQKDGTLEGPDLSGTEALMRRTNLPVILSGGIGSAEDLREILRMKKKPFGVITGKALYERKIRLKEAVELFTAEGESEESAPEEPEQNKQADKRKEPHDG